MPAQKFLQHNGSGGFNEVQAVQTATADAIPALDTNGRLDPTMMPTGIGADTAVIIADGALAAGDWVNVYNNGGTANVRKADGSGIATKCNGFVLNAYTNGQNATVYFEGSNTAVTGQTPGDVFLGTTAGAGASAAPTGAGEIVQRLGVAVSATQVNFERAEPIVLA